MSVHRWWLALIAALLTPWVGPHMDRYLPIGWLLGEAFTEAPDAGFWVIAGVLLLVCYAAWWILLTVSARLLRRLSHRKSSSGLA